MSRPPETAAGIAAARNRPLLFWVQHLLGIGHLRRATTLARAFVRAGFDVTLASGGYPVAGLDLGGARFVQLPAARAADIYFKDIRDAADRPVDDAWRADRRERLLALYREIRPDAIVTELFPFGRRQLAFELEPLLDMARADARRPLIACSVRDILVEPPKPERRTEMIDRVRRWFDLVLVHGDPSLVRFEETFPQAGEIAERIAYTGYVVDRGSGRRRMRRPGRGVLVSAGGGAVSEPLLRAAMAARPLTTLRDAPWRFLVGHALPEGVLESLRAAAPDGVSVERARPDFTRLLRDSLLSVSQAGYNTVMEVLDAKIRAVVVPYAGGLETEQTLRAERLAAHGALQVVGEAELTPESVAAAVERALAGPPAVLAGLGTRGAQVTARRIRSALAAREGG